MYQAQGGNGEKRTGTVGMSGSGRIDGTSRTTGWAPGCDCGGEPGEYYCDCGTWERIENLTNGCPKCGQTMYPAARPVPCTVLDPFGGAGTTALVSKQLGRNSIIIELNESYCDLARERLGLKLSAGE